MKKLYKQWSETDVIDLIRAYPLALMMSPDGGELTMTPLPMLPDTDDAGRLIRLVGHLALRNPHTDTLRRQPRAHFLFQGPQGYISPRLLADRNWAPTWNYAVIMIEADVRLTPERTDTAVRRLVEKLEHGRPDAWAVEELGDRYAKLAQRIVGFEAEVRSVDATFKLGQDESDHALQQILAGLDADDLREWMRRFARTRV